MSIRNRLGGLAAVTRAQSTRRRNSVPCGLEPLEARTHLSTTSPYRSYDGTGNNLSHKAWGSALSDLIRLSPVGYADGISSPSLPHDQSARVISNDVNNQADPANPSQDLNTLDQNNLSDYGYAFGQFMDHDLDLTNAGGAEFDIQIPSGDPMGPAPLAFTRSEVDPNTGTSTSNPRQQPTDITAFLDLSQVYGSDQASALALRYKNGLMKTSHGNMLPYLNSTYFTSAQLAVLNKAQGGQANNGSLPSTSLFATGDVRGNENIELTALQTVFLRNHNAIATKLHTLHSTWTDEQLYQEARKINIAEYQSIIYNEYIPALYGAHAMSAYSGYNSSVNPSISNEFSTVAFRMGHSMVSPSIAREDNNGLRIPNLGGDIPLAVDFFNPTLLNPSGVTDPNTGLKSTDIGPILKGSADGNGQAMDTMAVSAIRNLLFANFGGQGGEDLIARDIQRGRDNGIASYNTLRVAFHLPAVTSFAQITSNVHVQHELAQAYPGGVNTIDAFEGGIAEDHVAGSDVGPLFQKIMIDQFTRLRDGDRYFYLNENLTSEELSFFNADNTLTKVIESNTPLTNMQANAMVFVASALGAVQDSHGTRLSGVTVQIKDDTGAVVGTSVTDGAGHYFFDQQTGIDGTGNYTLSLVLNSSQHVTSGPGTILISRGDIHLINLNFVISTSTTAATTAATAAPASTNAATPASSSGPSVASSVFASDKDGSMADQILSLVA